MIEAAENERNAKAEESMARSVLRERVMPARPVGAVIEKEKLCRL